jgi:hypothetical protein
MEVLVGKVYKHYKGGRYYVFCISEESTNVREGNRAVVYFSLDKAIFHHREPAEFVEEIEWPDGVRRPRFVLEEK